MGDVLWFVVIFSWVFLKRESIVMLLNTPQLTTKTKQFLKDKTIISKNRMSKDERMLYNILTQKTVNLRLYVLFIGTF